MSTEFKFCQRLQISISTLNWKDRVITQKVNVQTHGSMVEQIQPKSPSLRGLLLVILTREASGSVSEGISWLG